MTLAVTAATEECYCEWRLEVNLLVEGEHTSWVRCGGVEEPDEVFC